MAVLEQRRGEVSAEDAEQFANQWVVIKDGKVVFGDPSADVVFDWLEQHKDLQPDLMTKLEDEPQAWVL